MVQSVGGFDPQSCPFCTEVSEHCRCHQFGEESWNVVVGLGHEAKPELSKAICLTFCSLLLHLESFGAGGSVPPEWDHISTGYPVPRESRDSSGKQAIPFIF